MNIFVLNAVHFELFPYFSLVQWFSKLSASVSLWRHVSHRVLGLPPRLFWLNRTEETWKLAFNKFPGDTGAAGMGATLWEWLAILLTVKIQCLRLSFSVRKSDCDLDWNWVHVPTCIREAELKDCITASQHWEFVQFVNMGVLIDAEFCAGYWELKILWWIKQLPFGCFTVCLWVKYNSEVPEERCKERALEFRGRPGHVWLTC